MKITCSFSAMVDTLNGLSTVVEDAMSSDALKNIIFRVYKDKRVDLIGINQIITYKVELPNGEYATEVDDAEFKDQDVFYFQLKSKELTSFLNTFKSVRRTNVDDVIFETVNNKVKVSVLETDLNTADKRVSHWLFDNIPIKPNLFESIDLKFPQESSSQVSTNAILLYTSTLLPIMQNGGTSLFSKLTFGEDKVVAFTTAFNTLMTNQLPDAFKGICLTYRAISFMKNVICSSPSVDVSRTDKYLCFKTENSEAFLIYDTRIANYQMYLDMFKKDHAIVLDRQYFKDVLKRLSLINDSVEFEVDADNNCVVVKNSKFEQEVPILQTKGMADIGKIKIKILPDVLDKAIVGDDSVFSDTVFIYFVPQQNGSFVLIFADDSGSWYSTASTR